MNSNALDLKSKRKYLPEDLKIETWNSIEPFFSVLENWRIESLQDLKNWLNYKSELDAALNEEMGWRYINMNRNTEDKSLSEYFEFYVAEIDPKISEKEFELNKILNDCSFKNQLRGKEFEILLRSVKNKIDLYRKENIPIQVEVQKEEQEYGRIAAGMTIHYHGEEMTLQKASNYLKETDRKIREEVYNLIWDRRLKDKDILDDLLLRLTIKRQQIAKNSGFDNFRDFMFRKLGRFDYSVEDCYAFHESVMSEVVPLVDEIHKTRKKKLDLDLLKPWDLEVNEDLKPALKPFSSANELIEKTIRCFEMINPEYAWFIDIMNKESYLDLDSRKGKAPGGFNYPLHESNIPFIFMNATGNIRDVETMVHEGGHAIHTFLAKDLELVSFKDAPSEIAELASMSMELIAMEHFQAFFADQEELKRAKRSVLLGIIEVLPWVAMIDKFQHLIYLEPDLTPEKMTDLWRQVALDYTGAVVDWTGQEDSLNHIWQRQLHIFEVPFYYIEYGLAQLGAIAIWRNYKMNPEKALMDYENALKLGYTRSIPEVYEAAGIEFNFTKVYIKELMQFVHDEIDKLED